MTGSRRSGIAAQSRVVVAALRREGIDVTLVSSEPLETGHSEPYLRDESGLVYPINSLSETLITLNPDLVIFHNAMASVRKAASEIQPYAITAARLGVNLREQLLGGEGYVHQIPELVDYIQGVDHLIASSDRVARTMRTHGVASGRITHIPTAIETADARDPADVVGESADRIGMIGRLRATKNQLPVIEGVSGLRERSPSIRPEILIAGAVSGTPSYPNMLQQLLSHVAPNFRTGFMDYVEDPMTDFYPEIDVHAHPSWTENCPQTILEAAVSGVPSIVSDMAWADAYPEMDLPRCPPDDPWAWTDELHRMLSDDAYRIEQARQQQAAAIEHYDIEDIVHDYLDLIDQLCDDYSAFKISTEVRPTP